MRLIIILASACAVPAVAAPPPKAPPVSINIKTGNAALLNFCNGLAQGVVQTEELNAGGSKICLFIPAPKCSETMKQPCATVRSRRTS